MKLKNKLLPFVGIAALGATFAPIALTSCGSKSSSNGVDLREWYTPTIEKHAYATMTSDEVANLYFCGDETAEWGDWLDEDEMIERLTQDYLFGSSMYVQYLNSNEINLPLGKLSEINKEGNASKEEQYLELYGIPNVQSVNMEQVEAKEAVASRTKVSYDKYDVTISNVRIGHMTNYYYGVLLAEEFPTISFDLDFDIDYTGISYSGLDDGLNIKIPDSISGRLTKSTTTQNHKGTLSVVNAPVMIDYEYCYEFGTTVWTLKLDYETMEQTELSTKVPFAVYGSDNVTYSTNAELDSRNQQFSGTKTYSFDYYSNMLWEQFVTDSNIITKANEAYTKAIEDGKTAAQAKKEKDEILITEGYAVQNLVNKLNANFLDVASYYLLSIACKY